MVTTIIEAFPKSKREPVNDGSEILHIAECFSNTIQGENFVGVPATFLRMQRCTLSCQFCDTTEVWRQGNPYSVNELIELWKNKGVIEKLKKGQHLVLTGGSPLLQQKALHDLISNIISKYGFKPFIEIENECTLMPEKSFQQFINIWNNSPKLKNSGMRKELRYKPQIIQYLSILSNSWFKFVINDENDWNEIKEEYVDRQLIKKRQIILMPEGKTRQELQNNYEKVLKICIQENIRMTDRLQITIWDKTTGV